MMEQLRLFQLENPLRARFGSGFFKQIPTSAGVYWMLDAQGRLLYVGKAKNLRARLKSYHLPSFEKFTTKTQRLLTHVHAIHWDLKKNETHALLTENEWLRTLKPPFNVQGTHPEASIFLAHRMTEVGLELRAAFSMSRLEPDHTVHGAFRGIPRVRLVHTALGRWAWARLHDNARFPLTLAKPIAPLTMIIPWPARMPETDRAIVMTDLERFLSGLVALPEMVLPEETPSLFLQNIWKDDQIRLIRFFQSTRHLRGLKDCFGLSRPTAQEEVDDLLVIARSRDRASESFSERQLEIALG